MMINGILHCQNRFINVDINWSYYSMTVCFDHIMVISYHEYTILICVQLYRLYNYNMFALYTNGWPEDDWFKHVAME
jgi:hypothetical protein